MASRSIAQGLLRPSRWAWALLSVAVGCGQEPAAPAPQPEHPAAEQSVQDIQQKASQLQAPAGCTEVTLGALHTGVDLTPTQYSAQPTYRGNFANFAGTADDLARIRLDVNTMPGLYDLSTGGTNLFTCEQCVYGYKDVGTADQTLFVAESGSMLLALKVSPDQTVGALANVTLRQSEDAAPFYAPYTGSAPVPGGQCLWIRFATWNTVRNGGCDPRQGALTSNMPGLTCAATDAAGNDGTLEKSLGTKTQGAACTLTPAASSHELATTDCATGYACSDTYTADRQCLATCDFLAANPGCPTGTVCGVYGLCMQQSVMESQGFDFDPALIGQTCTKSWAEYCGAEGARGVCVDLDGDGHGTCFRAARARSACGAGEELGYIGYPLANSGYDRSYGFCYPDGN
ncbi:hypothetical protein KRR26_30595 [Corallococcus sp. M34]|uniref:hypothetical protein n=1 Tax=Citreicoccus inhibens TaxID=2849499 RepID=UPI001C223304|nr:hypothetical protein [Citreicoccus inhibens]MBU8899965.1 hypothetical protein [Citreicoccus inhibens]